MKKEKWFNKIKKIIKIKKKNILKIVKKWI